MTDILCHACGHSINEHVGNSLLNGCEKYMANCKCKLTPQDIAAAAIKNWERLAEYAWHRNDCDCLDRTVVTPVCTCGFWNNRDKATKITKQETQS